MNGSITDPTDFRETELPLFSQLDSLLRCHICKDFLKVPVLTPCGHTFCSICIREAINKSAKCPLCLNELRESGLRGDFLTGEVVNCYQNLRQPLLERIQKVEEPTVAGSETSLIEIESDGDRERISDIEEDFQILATNERKRLPGIKKITKRPASRKGGSKSNIESMFKSGVEMGECPICNEFFPVKTIERTHMDECLTRQALGKPKPKRSVKTPFQTSNRPSSVDSIASNLKYGENGAQHLKNYLESAVNDEKRLRLPKLDYNTLSLSQLKQKLGSLGLPSFGSKQSLMARYNHYEMLWNSNFFDSSSPVNENELKRQLLSWEASNNLNSNNNNNTIGKMITKNKDGERTYQKLLFDFKSDKFKRKSWIRLFRRMFQTLIKEAKSKMQDKATEERDSDKRSDAPVSEDYQTLIPQPESNVASSTAVLALEDAQSAVKTPLDTETPSIESKSGQNPDMNIS
ncbi:E3 ubiquitin-protein ligase RAD18 KNAG_0I02880 [Huiozyma naganishii CBS 8797]|uniref:Postreplication repair E3 ubiquitin-protein ligase RAD18 n=1 Tax=Huiozyma naganishii (strain ATCC MYA-139 / BCRC 22969 / CBS 8797 / KCTC 17520 / NBRC 10181 / NCYC 3082 / Yp74L-3) TaxID=1071383 RepID=J7S2K1_HUIN7|nr:hypothetical protein KNAG_0I02880 [Kazachstania naganishii CBS 8797]CCK72072.1 hypothetical protein KNAG_0I02880 [Kazachstania naganishii CBS 8797]